MEDWSARLDIGNIAAEYRTPFYILNLAAVTEAVRSWADVTGDPSRIAYPVKTNPAMPLLKHLQRLGTRAECASEHEVTLALLAGFPLDRIVYNSPAANEPFAVELLRSGATVVADNPDMLQALAAAQQGEPGRLLVRIAPSTRPSYAAAEAWHTLTAHADPKTKFGIPAETLLGAVRQSGARVDGLHLHAGTMMDNAAVFPALRDELAGLAHALRAEGHPVRVINLGGGLAIPFQDMDTPPGIHDVGAALAEAGVGAAGIEGGELWVEPGHALVGRAVALVTRVVQMKSMRGRRWAICDVGSDQLVKVTLLDWRHRILRSDGTPLPMTGRDAVGGPLCFAGDVLLPETDLEGVARGDLLIVQHAGAYCAAMESRFNGRLSPELLVLDEQGRIERRQRRGHSLFTPEVMLHDWIMPACGDRPAGDGIDLEHVTALSSVYVRELARQDAFSYLKAQRLTGDSYRFEVDVSAAVPFVSLPFGIRIAGDAAIIAILDRAGFRAKEIPVWGQRLTLTADQTVHSTEPVVCDITLSPELPRFGKNSKRSLAAFKLNGGKMAGQFEMIW